MALVVVVHTVAVGAQDNALLYFFHRPLVLSVAYKLVDASGLGAGVCVMKVKRGWVVEPTFCTEQRGLERFPFFPFHRSIFIGLYLDLFGVLFVVFGGVAFLFVSANV